MPHIITKEFAERLKDHLAGAIDEVDEADALYQELQSLPVLEGDPVAWRIEFEHGGRDHSTVHGHNAIGDYRDNYPDAKSIPLYTHPAPFTPITADDVMNEMVDNFNIQFTNGSGMTNDDVIAAAVNAYMGAKK
jgi:hypothetical protein